MQYRVYTNCERSLSSLQSLQRTGIHYGASSSWAGRDARLCVVRQGNTAPHRAVRGKNSLTRWTVHVSLGSCRKRWRSSGPRSPTLLSRCVRPMNNPEIRWCPLVRARVEGHLSLDMILQAAEGAEMHSISRASGLKYATAVQTDAIMKVTSTCICGSDLHLYLGFVPGMEPGTASSQLVRQPEQCFRLQKPCMMEL